MAFGCTLAIGADTSSEPGEDLTTTQYPAGLTDSFRKEGYWTDRLLTDFFEDAVARSPDKIAVIDERFPPITYAEMAAVV